MKKIFEKLYGNLKFRKKIDYIVVPLKVIYIVFSIPFLIFTFLLGVSSGFGSPNNEKFGIVKLILLHMANIYWSIAFWGILINVILENYPPM